ncbi:hypothetical protein SAY87_010426 [Trapa incisa]|uniref:Bifunctional inhibitor/plant lipid transfer protein/seed storage helical domain-containing protein n=1 Tax=Trapa incisa TaxID=236973 RepID=A0AAN7JHL5_9MYRT|nr:hypothetical protein SAY87_010426 [Trapa incisa]
MAKLATLAVVLGVLLVAAAARTTTMTVEVGEEENQRRRGSSCWDQLQQAHMLSHCRDFLSDVSRGDEEGYSQCGYGRSTQLGPRSRRGIGGGSRHFDSCCDQLGQMDERCMCVGVREMMREEHGRLGEQEMEQMMQCAKQLPQMCGLGRSCSQMRVAHEVSE